MSYKVLVVDDNVNNSRLIEGVLSTTDHDFHCIFAMDGEEGFQKAKEEMPDLILMDMMMPKVNGIESLKLIQNCKELKDTPVIFITAHKTPENFAEAFQEGAFDFITKPIDINELRSRINKALSIGETLKRIRKKISIYKEEWENLESKALIPQNAQNSFILIDPTGQIEWANEGFYNLRGLHFEEFKLKYGASYESLSDNPKAIELFKEAIATRAPVSFISKIRHEDGSTRWAQTFVSPQSNGNEELVKLLAVESDITSLKKKEEELFLQNKRMLSITQNLENANELLEQQKAEINDQKRLVEEEKEKSERLLLNILPFEVARQLKSKGKAGTRYYKHVSVLFTDFKAFSRMSKDLEPKELVSILDTYFAKFDEITGNHYLEKIKTIGDAYMCCGGLPLRNKSNPVDAVLAGLEIQHFMNKLNDTKVLENLPVWELRVGIHTGPVVAGVVGKKKFAYDIWGETVNVASRMEHMGHVGMVNVSGTTYEYIKDYFDCDFRGNHEAKNVGQIDMYFVHRLKKEYAADESGIVPNEEFKRIVNRL